ncbi:S8 family serine peptidase [Hymenobacter algoricola]|uniref:Peptidase S8/S53 domain-containing protein n=1 Tax=Hymenobacter algoricola TaxID=486267 RepID=A0ABP7NUF1_9BACT
MQHLLPTLGLLAAFWTTTTAAQAQAPRLLVRLTDNVAAELAPASPTHDRLLAFEQLNRTHGARQVQALNPGRTRSADAAEPAPYLIELPAGTDVQQALREYQQSGLFQYVELDATGRSGGVQGFAPDDALYSRQWSLKNVGTFSLSPARAGADIKMEDAWAITRGDSSVTVAIIDSGLKLDHPEFSGRRIWRNRQEVPANGLDDDQNGYVDDVNGWNFAYNTNNPTDDQGHGTNVTGIIGATGNNALGYAGVNWGCKLMVCKGLNAQNSGQYAWWASAIYYAVNNGARVINMSVGGSGYSLTLQNAIDFAIQRGVVVVACMMNENNAVTYYPAGFAGVVAVGSTNPNDTRTSPFFWSATSGSNYGQHISLVAPGNYIYGLSHLSNTNYNSYWGGTSQATPHVAGLVSLLLTLKPQLTPAQVKTLLQATADDRVGGADDTPGWDQYYGHGRLNAARALLSIVTGTRAPQLAAAALQLYPNPAHDQLTLQVTDARLLPQDVRIFNGLGQLVHHQLLTGPTTQVPLALAPGAYWVTVAGTGRKLLVN